MTTKTPQQLDVLIIGAGISGIGMSYMLKTQRPHDSFAVIESRENIGGTWDLFRYPGIRSDSDMYTFAYSFKPWKDKECIGTADRIKHYLHELIDEEGLEQYIRYQQRVVKAAWDSQKARWCTTVTDKDGQAYTIEARFVVTCTGYYNYEKGYEPEFEGYEDFKGKIVHPQHWPENLDYKNKEVLVIGSGATAITVVPSMAKEAKHVTMLQRSPSYIVSIPSRDRLFQIISKWLPSGLTNRIMRAKYIVLQLLMFTLSRRFPEGMRQFIRRQNEKLLSGTVDVNKHFNPRYKPWDQRMCMVPNDDLFESLRKGETSIVTDQIVRFTETGVLLKSGQKLDADIVVPATGLDVQFWGGMEIEVDGQKIEAKNLTSYKGMMFSQMPNFATIFGYTNAPWTLKAELTYGYICRLLDYMQNRGKQIVYPCLEGASAQEDLLDLQSGYIARAKDKLPRQGSIFPWRNKDLYVKDLFAIKHRRLNDSVLKFDDLKPIDRFHKKTELTNAS